MTTFVRRIAPLCVVLGLSGCASAPATDRSVPATVRLAVDNRTDYTWQIVVAPTGGGAPQTARVPPRGTFELALAGGDYAITQTMLMAGGASPSTRRLTAHFESGESYRWPLATLLSAGSQAAAREIVRP